jgi:hypothetical protein
VNEATDGAIGAVDAIIEWTRFLGTFGSFLGIFGSRLLTVAISLT